MTNNIISVCKESLVAVSSGLRLGPGAVVISVALPSMKGFFVLNGVCDWVRVSVLTFGCSIGDTFSKKAGEFFKRDKTLEKLKL